MGTKNQERSYLSFKALGQRLYYLGRCSLE